MFAAPRGEMPRVAALTYLTGSLICHQQPTRSFYRAGSQLPVCARCLGLYVGALVGVAGWAIMSGLGGTSRPRGARLLQPPVVRGALIVAALPTLATVATAWAGVWDASNIVRATLALPLGALIAVAVTAVAAGDLR